LRQQLDQQQLVQPDLATMRKIGARQLKEVLSVRSKAAMIELDAYLTSRHQRDALAVRSRLFAEVSRWAPRLSFGCLVVPDLDTFTRDILPLLDENAIGERAWIDKLKACGKWSGV